MNKLDDLLKLVSECKDDCRYCPENPDADDGLARLIRLGNEAKAELPNLIAALKEAVDCIEKHFCNFGVTDGEAPCPQCGSLTRINQLLGSE